MKILIVDDDVDLLDLTGYALRRDGFTVVQAVDGEQALQRWERERPDLVLLDVEMPALSGEHVLSLTPMFDFLRDVPIVLHSAKGDEELQALVAKSNARGYIRKSGNPISFVEQVRGFLPAAG